MMIILISSTAEPTSGWGAITHHHCLALLRQGVPFVLLLPKNAPRAQTEYSDRIKYLLPHLPLSFANFLEWPKIIRFWSSLKINAAPDSLVHSLVDFPYAVWGWYFAKKNKLPFIFNAAGSYSVAPFFRFPDRHLFLPVYKNARAIIAISQFTAEKMVEAAGLQRKIEVLNLPPCK